MVQYKLTLFNAKYLLEGGLDMHLDAASDEEAKELAYKIADFFAVKSFTLIKTVTKQTSCIFEDGALDSFT
jgi:hypothetical protein